MYHWYYRVVCYMTLSWQRLKNSEIGIGSGVLPHKNLICVGLVLVLCIRQQRNCLGSCKNGIAHYVVRKYLIKYFLWLRGKLQLVGQKMYLTAY